MTPLRPLAVRPAICLTCLSLSLALAGAASAPQIRPAPEAIHDGVGPDHGEAVARVIATPESEVAGGRVEGRSSPVLDLYALASHAHWTSTAGALPFNGPEDDSSGCVRALGQTTLADGTPYELVLLTQPGSAASGYILGSYELTIPAGATVLSAKIGFLPGATGSDGVTVRATLREPGRILRIVSQYLAPVDGVVGLSGTIPEAWRGRALTLELRVDAGPSATQDSLVWVAPAIR